MALGLGARGIGNKQESIRFHPPGSQKMKKYTYILICFIAKRK